MKDHLTYYTYNVSPIIAKEFCILNLPLELILAVVGYLDFDDLENIRCTSKFFNQIITQYYFNFLLNQRNSQVRIRLNNWFRFELRPSLLDLYNWRVLSYRMYLNQRFLSNDGVINNFEVITLLTKLFKRNSLDRLLSKRPSKKELIEKGIIKPVFDNIEDLNEEELSYLTKPITTKQIKNKIQKLEKENLSNILKNFLIKYKFKKSHYIRFKNSNSCYDDFLKTVKFFENLKESEQDSKMTYSSVKGFKSKSERPSKKVLLNAKVVGHKVYFVS